VDRSVIKAIRGISALNRIIYVACDAALATKNFVDLCRGTSNQWLEKPFKPVFAQPVDMFPHTKHCELIVVFERDEAYPDAKSQITGVTNISDIVIE